MKFLFLYGERRREVEADATHDSVMSTFRTTFDTMAEDTFQAQIYSTEWDEFVDVVDFSILRNKTKIRFVKKALPADDDDGGSDRDVEDFEDPDRDVSDEDDDMVACPVPIAFKDQRFREMRKNALYSNRDDIPCPCRLEFIDEECVLYNINKGILNRGVGLLCYRAHPNDAHKVNNASRCSWTAYCIRAYPERNHLLPRTNCKTMKLAKRWLRGMVSGAEVSNHPHSVASYDDSVGYVLSEERIEDEDLQPPVSLKVPTPDGYVYLKCAPSETICIMLTRGHCKHCQG